MMAKYLQPVAQLYKSSGGGESMNDSERITRLETRVDHVENDIRDIKADIRDIRMDIRDIRAEMGEMYKRLHQEINDVKDTLNNKIDANFKWLIGVMITSGVSAITSIAGVVLHFVA